MADKRMQDIRFPAEPQRDRPPKTSSLRRWGGRFAVLSIIVIIAAAFLWRVELPRKTDNPEIVAPSGEGWRAWGALRDTAFGIFGLAGSANRLATEAPHLILSGQGENAIALLRDFGNKLQKAEDTLSEIKSILGGLPFFPGDIMARLTDGRSLVNAWTAWADTPDTRRIIVLFNNTSELRPGGGFIGSYAEIDLTRGGMTSMTVHDINDSDKNFSKKIIPPLPLRSIVRQFRAADSNWFFDFRDSASTTLDYLEQSSSIPAGTRYDGVIAVSPKVIADILAVTGPVNLPDGTMVNQDNLLPAIQEEVQSGQAEGSSAPKAILAELTPVLKERLDHLSADQAASIIGYLPDWVAHKDVMFYFCDSELEASVTKWQASGALYDIPSGFEGDYLAAVNANVGGGKTDFVMRESVALKSSISLDGTVSDDLAITREHDGNSRTEWWYQVPNWNYLQVFVPDGAGMSSVSGGTVRQFRDRVNYKKGFTADPAVQAIEDTLQKDVRFPGLDIFRESGRTVFATWVRTDSGSSSTVNMTYARTLPQVPADGQNYTFVFETQSGWNGSFKVEIAAPPGFVWAENGNNVYEISNDNPPGRIETKLTFRLAP